MKKPFTFRSRIHSIRYALRGLHTLFRTEPNIGIHLLATITVVLFAVYRNPGKSGWIALVISIALVWIAEAFNTAMELLCDLYTGHAFHPIVRQIKDISAAAVLLAAIASLVIAGFVFF